MDKIFNIGRALFFSRFTGKHCPREEAAQETTANLSTYKAMINAACVCGILMYAGAWSDSRGKQRKPLILVSIIGERWEIILGCYITSHFTSTLYYVPYNVADIFSCFRLCKKKNVQYFFDLRINLKKIWDLFRHNISTSWRSLKNVCWSVGLSRAYLLISIFFIE